MTAKGQPTNYYRLEEDQYIRANCSTMTPAEIGAVLGRSGSSVAARMDKIGVDLRRHQRIRQIIKRQQAGGHSHEHAVMMPRAVNTARHRCNLTPRQRQLWHEYCMDVMTDYLTAKQLAAAGS